MSEIPYQSFFNLSVDMLCIAGMDGYFKQLNPAWSRTLGFTEAELLARPYMDLVHPDDRASTAAEAENLTSGSTTVHFRNRYLCRDGSYRWLAWTATPAESTKLIYAVARDITQEMEAEDQLRAATLAADRRLALLAALVDAIGIGVLLIDHDLKVAYWNKEATRLTGIPMEKALGAPAREIGQALSG